MPFDTPKERLPDVSAREKITSTFAEHLEGLQDSVQRGVVETALRKVKDLKPETIQRCMKTLEDAQRLDKATPEYRRAMEQLSSEVLNGETTGGKLKEFSDAITKNLKSAMEQLSVLGTEVLQQIADLFPNSTIGKICDYVGNTLTAFGVTIQKTFIEAKIALSPELDFAKISKFMKGEVDALRKRIPGFKLTDYLHGIMLELEEGKNITMDVLKKASAAVIKKTLDAIPVAQTTPVQPPAAQKPEEKKAA